LEEITLKHIARALNTSVSTVSRALKDYPRISEKKRKEIKAYAWKLGYFNNKLAQGLKNKKTGLIGVVIPDLNNLFFAKVLSGIQDYLFDAGYEILVGQSLESIDREADLIQRYMAYGIEGLIIACSKETSEILTNNNRLKNLPAIFFDRVTQERNIHKVLVDNYAGTYEVMDLLIKKGFTKIHCIAGPENMSISENRIQGLNDALAFHKNNKCNVEITYSNMTEEACDDILGQICDEEEMPEIIFGIMDKITIQILKYIDSHNIEDVKVVGYVDDHYLGIGEEKMVRIYQPSYEIGMSTARQIKKLITGQRVSYTELLRPEVVIGSRF